MLHTLYMFHMFYVLHLGYKNSSFTKILRFRMRIFSKKYIEMPAYNSAAGIPYGINPGHIFIRRWEDNMQPGA